MRIEILVGAEDPVVHPFKDSKMSIGSGETNDIILSANGVSRKHILITFDGENYFVTDQGSTNGSYMNEERLVPGRKVEFNSFFPVRLGDDVLISLVSDDDGLFDLTDEVDVTPPVQEVKPSFEATSVIPLKALKEAKTEKLVQRREVKRTEVRARVEKKKKPAPKPKSNFSFSSFFVIAAFATTCYYYFFYKPKIIAVKPSPVTKAIEPTPETAAEAPKEISLLLDEADVPTQKKMTDVLNEMKCLTDEEKVLCDILPGAKGDVYGVTKIGTMFYVLVDGLPYLDRAEILSGSRKPQVLSSDSAVEVTESPQQIEAEVKEAFDPSHQKFMHEVAAVIYIHAIPQTFDMSLFKDSPVTFLFLDSKSSRPSLRFSMVITSSSLKDFKNRLKEEYFSRMRRDKGIMLVAPRFMRVL